MAPDMAQRRTLFSQIDFIMFASVMVMMAIGIMFIYSSGVTSKGDSVSTEWIRQLIWMTMGIVAMIGLSFVRYDLFREIALFLFLGFLVMVIVASFMGRMVNGSRNWIGIGELGIQPSEFLKIATILLLAVVVDGWGEKIRSLRYFALASGLVLVPMVIILVQQDLGTSMVFVPIFFFMLFVGGANPRHLIYVLATILLSIFLIILVSWNQYLLKVHLPFLAIFQDKTLFLILAGSLAVLTAVSFIAWRIFHRTYFYYLTYIFSILLCAVIIQFLARAVLKPYQVKRLIVFLDPSFDAKGAGWNIIQSITAVGSGGMWGKGYLHGVQTHLQFLPEQSTDFIFSILSEEWGFVGGLGVLVCYMVLLYRGLNITMKARDTFGALIAAGIVGMYFFHMLINVGMAIGVMPIVGIPLFFLSYGGSSLITAFIALGILMSVNAHRYQF